MRKPRVYVLALSCLFSALLAGIASADAPSAEILEKLTRSAVFLRTERVFKYESFPTSGTGFFVHPNGYILTNWHVVADEIEVDLWGKKREVSAKVLKLTAVVDSGMPSEREFPATIVARDRQRDLALLRVDFHPPSFIEISEVKDAGVGRQVWTAGFPFGDLLAVKQESDVAADKNPEVTISSGMVTSLRRDPDGKLTKVQTDAPLNPGNSGGAMVDASGDLVGVVSSGIQGGEGLGFGVSPNRIREFVQRQAIRINFSPGVVLSPPQPIKVTIKPILIGADLQRGEVRFEGDDIVPVRFELGSMEGEVGLETTIEFPERIPGKLRPKKYFATISLSSRSPGKPIRRRYSLDAVQESFETLKSERDPGQMMEDRKILSHEVSISDYTRDQQVAGGVKDQTKLSDIAGSMELERDDSGSVVVDNSLVKEVGAVKLDSSRYQYIPGQDLRKQLAEYDRLGMEVRTLESERHNALEGNTYESYMYAVDLNRTIGEVQQKRYELAGLLSRAKVRWCPDEEVYFIADGERKLYPCNGRSLGY